MVAESIPLYLEASDIQLAVIRTWHELNARLEHAMYFDPHVMRQVKVAYESLRETARAQARLGGLDSIQVVDATGNVIATWTLTDA